MTDIIVEAEVKSNVMVEPSLDLRYKELAGPAYKYTQVLPNNSGVTQTVSTAQTQTFFNVSGGVINWSKNYISLSPTLATPGANLANWLHVDTPAVQTINLKSKSGVIMASVDNVQQYLKMARYACSTPDEMEKGAVIMAADAASAWQLGTFMQKSQALSAQAFAANTPSAGYILDAGTTGAGALSKLVGVDVPYDAPQHLISGTINTTTAINMILPLKALVHTIFSLDKDIFYSEDMILEVYWKPVSYWGFIATDAIVPSVGTATLGTITLNNYYLMVAYDQNQDNVAKLSNQTLRGDMHINLPYVHCFRDSSPAGSTYMSSYRFTRGHGKTLRRVYTGCFNVTETLNLAANNTNNYDATVDVTNYAKVTQLQTFLDSNPIQNSPMVVNNHEDYEQIRKVLLGSVLQSERLWRNQYFWVDNFAGDRPSIEWVAHDDEEGGVDLSRDRLYNAKTSQGLIAAGTYAQRVYYTFAVCDKDLVISANGIMVR